MNKKSSKNASDLYKANLYFVEGISFFRTRYLSTVLYRNLYVVTSVLLISTIYFSVKIMQNFYPMKTIKHLVITEKYFQTDQAKFKKLPSYSHPTLSIAGVLMEKYVNVRENYEYKGFSSIAKVREKIDIIRNMSSKIMFNKFLENEGSVDDFMFLLKNKMTKITKIIELKYKSGYSFIDKIIYMISPGKIPNSATIFVETSVDGEISQYRIDIKYYIKIPQKLQYEANNKKLNNIKLYLTGTSEQYSKQIDFTILDYQKTKMS